jgi:hypothetical protein
MADPPDSDIVAFPDPNEIGPHAITFAAMMFAHAALEREISALQDVITKTPGFGERRLNLWSARERPRRIVKLIETHRGDELPHTNQIAKLLIEAVDPCEQRNLLAHGTWWCFNRRTSAVVVRGAVRWDYPESQPKQREYTADDIYALAEKLKTIETELYKLRRAIEEPLTPLSEAEIREHGLAAVLAEIDNFRR